MGSTDAFGGVFGIAGGKVDELAVEVAALFGLQVPHASSSEDSEGGTAMTEAAAWADEPARGPILGGVIGC